MFSFFFFNDTATTEIYTLSLHDALPISPSRVRTSPIQSPSEDETSNAPVYDAWVQSRADCPVNHWPSQVPTSPRRCRSEEHTSELQSRQYLVCRLLLEKKKTTEKQVNVS